MDYFFDEVSRERFQFFVEWKQERILKYAEEHNAKIGIHSDQCLQILYLYRNHYRGKWQYGHDGLHLFQALFLLPNDTVTDGNVVIYPKQEKAKSEYTPVKPVKLIEKEWEICKMDYPEDTGMTIFLKRKGETFFLYCIPKLSLFGKNTKVPGCIRKLENDGKVTYEFVFGFKQINIHKKVSEEWVNHLIKKVEDIKKLELPSCKTKYGNLILHIPHSSPLGLDSSGWQQTKQFQREVNRWTDWATDEIFTGNVYDYETERRIHVVKFPLSRFVLDVERLPDDPLETIGQGRVYHQFGTCKREISDEEEKRLLNIYDSFQKKVVSELTPDTLLIDCHSFPSNISDIDVCIGYNEDWSKPSQEVIGIIVQAFEKEGYRVGINRPYKNSIAPKCDFTYHSVMIELNKRTYWDELKLEKNKEAFKINSLLMNLFSQLLI